MSEGNLTKPLTEYKMFLLRNLQSPILISNPITKTGKALQRSFPMSFFFALRHKKYSEVLLKCFHDIYLFNQRYIKKIGRHGSDKASFKILMFTACSGLFRH